MSILNRFCLYVIPLALLLSLMSCDPSGSSVEERTLEIDHYKQGFGLGAKYRHRETNAEDLSENFFYQYIDTIEGFSYEWGFKYEIVVEVTIYHHHSVYKLKEIISKEYQENIEFNLEVYTDSINRAEQSLIRLDDNTFILFGEVNLTCNSPLGNYCSLLDDFIANEDFIYINLKHPENSSSSLEVVNVICNVSVEDGWIVIEEDEYQALCQN
jgi:hypothetical protein